MSYLYLNKLDDSNLDKNINSFSAKNLTIKTEPFFSDGYKDNNSNKNKKNIAKFILGKKLGQGTFATVRLATHIETKEIVAIKILDKQKLEENVKKRLDKEIKILKQVRHRNIVHLYNVVYTNKEIYLIMEYVRGKELFTYINERKRLGEIESCHFYQQIISGLEYLEKLKIVHRDIKPENIIIEGNKNIKIIDFGLSNIYPENNILFSSCGSPCYAPPEMIMGKKYTGSGVDIWSSGIVLYGMLCGYLPFTDPDESKLYKKIISGKLSFPHYLSENAKDLLNKILEKDPQKRITIKKIKKHPWFNLINPKIKNNLIFLPNELITPIDLDIIDTMVSNYGYNEAEVKIDLIKNKHNYNTTTYYLLLDAKTKKGEKSIGDMKSKEYFTYVNNPCNFFSHYNYDMNKVIKERVYKNLNEREINNKLNINKKVNSYKIIHKNLSLKKTNKVLIRKNIKKEKLGETFIKTDINSNINIINNKDIDITKNIASIDFTDIDIDNKEEYICDNDYSINIFNINYKNNEKKSNNNSALKKKIRKRNLSQFKKNKYNKLIANTTYFQRPKRSKYESLEKNKNESINKNKIEIKQNMNLLNDNNDIKEKIKKQNMLNNFKLIKKNSKNKKNNNSISNLKMNGYKKKNGINKSQENKEIFDLKNDINESDNKSYLLYKKSSGTIKVNNLNNEKKILSKKLINKKTEPINNNIKSNNNHLETNSFMNKSQFGAKRSKNVFPMISLKKNPNKSINNQTYQKQEKISKNNENEDKEDYKRNTTKKNVKLNSFKKNSSNISLKKNKKNNISPKNIFKKKLYVKLIKPNENYLTNEKKNKKQNYNIESLKNNNLDINKTNYININKSNNDSSNNNSEEINKLKNNNDDFDKIREEQKYKKLKTIDLKIKNLTRNKYKDNKNDKDRIRAESVKERNLVIEKIQKKNTKKNVQNIENRNKLNEFNSKSKFNKIKINKRMNTNNNNIKYLKKRNKYLNTDYELEKNNYFDLNTISNNNANTFNNIIDISVNIENEKEFSLFRKKNSFNEIKKNYNTCKNIINNKNKKDNINKVDVYLPFDLKTIFISNNNLNEINIILERFLKMNNVKFIKQKNKYNCFHKDNKFEIYVNVIDECNSLFNLNISIKNSLNKYIQDLINNIMFNIIEN